MITDGHWECDGEEYCSEDEVREAVLERIDDDPYAFEVWLDDNYSASELLSKVSDCEFASSVQVDLWSEFEQDTLDEMGMPVEGEDFITDYMDFKWVEDEDEE